jgi:lantibiotic modifying enzyme
MSRDEEIRALVDHASLVRSNRSATLLEQLCCVGVSFAEMGLRLRPDHRQQLAPKARRSLASHLHKRLREATAPALSVYLHAAEAAARALALQTDVPLRTHLLRLFASFPALAPLWLALIANWRAATAELLRRLARDRTAIERTFFALGEVIDLRAGLSDPHAGGRTVMELRFRAGGLIYKPRPGHGERAWFDALRWLNSRGFEPPFRTLCILERQNHCWMEVASATPARSLAGVRRFYQRAGAMLALADRLGAVDCHRDNIIAAGEHPVLVDAETLLHPRNGSGHSSSRLFETGFLPLPPGAPGAEYRASGLSAAAGPHLPMSHGEISDPADYRAELLEGFRLASSILASAEFSRRVARLRKLRWRRIYRPTIDYDRISAESVLPDALRAAGERTARIAQRCARAGVSGRVLREELAAISQLDVPYFTGRAIAPSAAAPDVSSLAAALDQSCWR